MWTNSQLGLLSHRPDWVVTTFPNCTRAQRHRLSAHQCVSDAHVSDKPLAAAEGYPVRLSICIRSRQTIVDRNNAVGPLQTCAVDTTRVA